MRQKPTTVADVCSLTLPFALLLWRSGRDSNPRGTVFAAPTAFPEPPLRPLGHHSAQLQDSGGEGGIRTPEGWSFPPLRDFESRPFVHSGTSPIFSLAQHAIPKTKMSPRFNSLASHWTLPNNSKPCASLAFNYRPHLLNANLRNFLGIPLPQFPVE